MENKRAFIFRTRRLEVRAFAPEDHARLSEIGGKADVARMLSTVKAPWSDADVKSWIDESVYKQKLGYRAGVYLPDGKLIGFVGVGGTPPSCAFAIDSTYQGNGYATEAVEGLLVHAFEALDAQTLEAEHFADNSKSGKVLRKLGFQKLGEGIGKSAARLEPAPIVLYRLTKQQFKAAKHEIS